VYPSIPAHQRRPIRVLSLFDGIATGLHASKLLEYFQPKIQKSVIMPVYIIQQFFFLIFAKQHLLFFDFVYLKVYAMAMHCGS